MVVLNPTTPRQHAGYRSVIGLSFGLTLMIAFIFLSTLIWSLITLLPVHSWKLNEASITSSLKVPKASFYSASALSSSSHRQLLEFTQNHHCQRYLDQFLNGTTDLKDECQALRYAFDAANCPTTTTGNNIDVGPTPGFLPLANPKKNGEGAADAAEGRNEDDDDEINEEAAVIDCCHSMEGYMFLNCSDFQGGPYSMTIVGIILMVFLCACAKAGLSYLQIGWLPDACAYILVGATIGMMYEMNDPTLVHEKFYFDEDFFLQLLLPPIIFEAALSIDKRAFRRDIFCILLFAGLGTILSAVSIGWMTHWMTHGQLPLLESLVFGALISSIDPVATLGILSGVGVDPSGTLYTLIFGESLLNDGVAIVLFETLQSHLGDQDALDNPETYREMAQEFVSVLFGSVGIAFATGVGSIIFFWMLQGRQGAVTEVATFFGWALIPYYLAEFFGFSGIIAILTMGFLMDFYILGGGEAATCTILPPMVGDGGERQPQHGISFRQAFSGSNLLSAQLCQHIGFLAHSLSSLAETIVFAYLGLFLFEDKVYSVGLDLVAILTCVISRVVVVIFLSALVNLAIRCRLEARVRKAVRTCLRYSANSTENEDADGNSGDGALDRKTQLILILAGIRGAVSFALVSNIPVYDVVTQHGTKYKGELKAMTSTAIIFTLFVFGGLTYYAVNRLAPSNGTTALESKNIPKEEQDQLVTRNKGGSASEYGSLI